MEIVLIPVGQAMISPALTLAIIKFYPGFLNSNFLVVSWLKLPSERSLLVCYSSLVM